MLDMDRGFADKYIFLSNGYCKVESTIEVPCLHYCTPGPFLARHESSICRETLCLTSSSCLASTALLSTTRMAWRRVRSFVKE